MIDDDVQTILDAVPEFADCYIDLVEAADGDPGAAMVFGELAWYVSDLTASVEPCRCLLQRCLAAVETVAHASADAQELVGGAFLDNLPPADLRSLMPWFGPHTAAMVEAGDEDRCR